MTTTPTEFLLARIAEDEYDARDATPGPWQWLDPTESAAAMGERNLRADGEIPVMVGRIDFPIDLRHVARHDPTRVLAECEAKRRIVELHANAGAEWDMAYCATCEDRTAHDAADWPCDTIRALTLPYSDHPEYDEAWRP